MFKIYDESESRNEGACLRLDKIYDEPESLTKGGLFKMYEEPESPNEGACLRKLMHPKRFEAESLNPKVESGGQVTPKFGSRPVRNCSG